MNLLVEKVKEGFGLPLESQVEAKLYKLLVYESGGKFDKHHDTEKEHGMFGTMVVELHSDYEGGAMTVVHNGKSITFDFARSASLFCESIIAFIQRLTCLQRALLCLLC